MINLNFIKRKNKNTETTLKYDISTEVDNIVAECEDNDTVVFCASCNGDMLKKYAIKRKSIRFSEGKEVANDYYYCKDCNDKLERGDVAREIYD